MILSCQCLNVSSFKTNNGISCVEGEGALAGVGHSTGKSLIPLCGNAWVMGIGIMCTTPGVTQAGDRQNDKSYGRNY